MDPVLFPKQALGRARDSPPPEAPKAGALAFPLVLSDLDRRELGGWELWQIGLTLLGKAVSAKPSLQQEQLVGYYTTYHPGQYKGLDQWLRKLEGAQGRARLGGMGSEKGLGAGCWSGPRGGKPQAL